jgi:transposase-like protein
MLQGCTNMSLRSIIATIKLWCGYDVCPQCGSYNIMKHGFSGSNLRYSCHDCGKTTRIIG